MTTINDLPEELQLYVLYFVEDYDMQSVSKVNHSLRKLSSDIILWKHYHLVRNAKLIDSRLFKPQNHTRPDRVELVDKNILKGVQPHQIQRGVYVNGPQLQHMHEAQSKLEKQFKQGALKKTLKNRPQSLDLQKKNILPDGIRVDSTGLSPILVQRVLKLRKALTESNIKSKLSRKLEKRASSYSEFV